MIKLCKRRNNEKIRISKLIRRKRKESSKELAED